MKRKLNEETILNTLFETVQPRTHIHQRVHNEESFEATRKRIPKISGTFAGIFVRRHPFFESHYRNPTTRKLEEFNHREV